MFSPCSVPKEIIGCLIGLQSKLKVCSIHDALCVEMGCVGEIMNGGCEDNSSRMEERGCHPCCQAVHAYKYSDAGMRSSGWKRSIPCTLKSRVKITIRYCGI